MHLRFATTAQRRARSLFDQRLTTVVVEQPRVAVAAELGWLIAALALTLLFIARAMAPAFSPDVIQDDARQHVFWLARFRDPELFQNDLIANYYQALAPPGYSTLYWALSWAVDPLLASKFLPIPLGLAAAVFTFLLARCLHPAPVGAFLATVLLSWYIWQYDDLTSATPRAFLLPLLVAQVWALAAGRLALGAGLAVVGGLVYPVAGLLGMTLLGIRLVRLVGWRPRLARERSAWMAFLAAGALVGVALLPSYLAGSEFGPAVSGARARTMPEFGPQGRFAFFFNDAYRYWVSSPNSAFDLRATDALTQTPILFAYLALAALLPVLVWRRLVGADRVSGQSVILLQLLMVSLGLYGLAHLLLFHLYVPSRYVKWSVPLVLAVAAGLVLGMLFQALAARVRPAGSGLVAGGLSLGLGFALAVHPSRYFGGFTADAHPTITTYLRAQPKDVLIAGVPIETDLVPSLAGRRVLADREHVYAWHLGYYREMRRRLEHLIEAYYTDSPRDLADFAARYGVDLFLVNRSAFRPETSSTTWTGTPTQRFEPFVSAVSDEVRGTKRFALLELAGRCAAVDDGEVAVVPTACLPAPRAVNPEP